MIYRIILVTDYIRHNDHNSYNDDDDDDADYIGCVTIILLA